jgi:hypothetical protein
MAKPFLRFRTLAIALLILGGIASAEDTKNPLVERIKRFKALPESEKAVLRERWKRFQSLPKGEQQALRERLRLLRSQSKSEQKRIRKQRDHFKRLKGDKRQDFQRKHMKMRRMMRRLQQSLPQEEKDRLAALSPEERHKALRELFKKQIVGRRLARLPKPLVHQLKRRLKKQSFSKSLETLRQANKEYGPMAQKFFAKLRQRHGKKIYGILETSKRRGESPEQLTDRFDKFLARVAPSISNERRAIFAYMLAHHKEHDRRGGWGKRRGDKDGKRRGDKDGKGPKRNSPGKNRVKKRPNQ